MLPGPLPSPKQPSTVREGDLMHEPVAELWSGANTASQGPRSTEPQESQW